MARGLRQLGEAVLNLGARTPTSDGGSIARAVWRYSPQSAAARATAILLARMNLEQLSKFIERRKEEADDRVLRDEKPTDNAFIEAFDSGFRVVQRHPYGVDVLWLGRVAGAAGAEDSDRIGGLAVCDESCESRDFRIRSNNATDG